MSFLLTKAGIALFWLAVAILMIIAEALTMGLTCIWFVGGALVAMVAGLLGASPLVQIIVFLLVSLVLMAFTRKVFVGKLRTGGEVTNAPALEGKLAKVTADILPRSTGRINIGGQDWAATAKDSDTTILAGSTVKILSVEGVKLIVELEEE